MTMTVRVLVAFVHGGREVQPGDRLYLLPDEAAFLSARGLVQSDSVLTVRVAS